MNVLAFGLIIKNGKIFVSNDYDKNAHFFFACTLKDHRPNTMLISSMKKYSCWKTFADNFKMGNVYFESQKIKHVTNEVFRLVMSVR